MEITLDEGRIKTLTVKTQGYFKNEHDDPIGELKASMIIEFFIKELGPQIYNQAITDAYAFIQDKIIDLEDSLYVPE